MDLTIHRAFRRQAALTPEAPAVVSGHRILSYAEVDRLSDAVAGRLTQAGVQAGTRVPVSLPRSSELVLTLLGILKCGASYAALDPAWPAARIEELRRRLGGPLVTHAFLDGWSAAAPPPEDSCDQHDPAAIFFTSGSTGTPKGAISPHRGIVRLIAGCTFADFGPGTVMPLAAALPWDALSLELWGPLITGGTSVVVDEPYLEPAVLRRVIARHGANTAWLSASLFNMVVDEDLDAFDGLSQVLIGGERLSAQHVRRFLCRFPVTRLVNGYGPVEATVFATAHQVSMADCDDPAGIPIGRAVGDTDVLVVNGGRVCGPGEPGEICVAGGRLAIGYLDDDRATAEKFVGLPAAGTVLRVYRTGDLGHWSPDGLLYYGGRLDRQVKVRGYRIVPEEVEAAILQVPGVTGCIVVPVPGRSAGTFDRLVAAYTGKADETWVRRSLSETLPGYAVPSRCWQMAALPLLPNGKLDRGAASEQVLALASAGGPETPSATADTALSSVIGVFSEVLGHGGISPDDSFFALGGSSLDAGRVCVRLGTRWSMPVPVSQLISDPTPAGLAAWLRGRRRASQPEEAPVSQGVPLLPMQETFLMNHLFEDDDSAAHCLLAWWISGPLDLRILAESVNDVQVRHEALRCRYVLSDRPAAFPGEPVGGFGELPPAVDEDAALRLVRRELMLPLDLPAGRVWRATAVRNAQTERTLFALAIHHVAFDGASERLLADDLSAAYAARLRGAVPWFPEPAPTLAHMQRAYARQRECADLERQEEYWRTALTGLEELAWGAPPAPSEDGIRSTDLLVTRRELLRCDAAAEAAGITRFAILLSAYADALAAVTGRHDLGIGVPVSKRSAPALQEGINCLIDVVCVRLRPDSGGSAPVAAALGHALAAQDIPLSEVMRIVKPVRTERNPLYQTMFVLQEDSSPPLAFPRCGAEFVRLLPPTAMTELAVTVWADASGGRITFLWRPDAVDTPTVESIRTAMADKLRTIPACSLARDEEDRS